MKPGWCRFDECGFDKPARPIGGSTPTEKLIKRNGAPMVPVYIGTYGVVLVKANTLIVVEGFKLREGDVKFGVEGSGNFFEKG